MKSDHRCTRRSFVKGVALTGGSALLPEMALAQTVSTITRLNKQPASQPGGSWVYAWSIPADRQIDFLILYSSTETSEPRTLAEVIAQWKNGSAKGIYFFEPAEARTIEELPAARLNSLLDRVDGLIAAYRGNLESDSLFLAGQGGNERLYFGDNIILEQFPTLNELEFRVETDQLKITRTGGFRLRFRAPAESRYAQISVGELTLDLRAPAPFRSGGFRIDLTKENFGAVASKLLRLAIYATTPNPRGYVLSHQTCRFFDPLKLSLREDQQKACELVLDLREVQGPWVSPPPGAAMRRLANSRVENFVVGLNLDTAYRTESGNAVVLSPQRASVQVDPARFLLVEDRDFLAADFEPTSAERATILFTPIGTFQFVTNRIDDPVFGMVVGRHATDRLKCQVGDFLVFEAGHPSIYVDPKQQTPALNDEENSGIPEVLHGAQGGAVHSSWAKYVAAGNRPQNEQAKIGYFFCESKDDPPMGRADQVDKVLEEKGVTIDLKRMDLAVGQVSEVIPMLPWGGTDAELADEELAKFENFDATHLAPARQIRVRGAAKNRPQVANGGSKFGVTPQGLLAEIDDADFGANFKTIYFGSAKKGEAEIVLKNIHPLEAGAAGDKKNRQKLQEALRASQSFLVAYTKEGLGRFSVRVQVDVFTFDIQLDKPLPEGACVIVKLRSDLSLRELLADTSRWSCPEALNQERLDRSAKEAKGKEILAYLEEGAKDTLKEGTKEPSPPAARLSRILSRKDWQGILFVKMKPTDMPSILEALRPGIQGDNLYVHHVGLDLLPARTEDLPKANAKPELKRLGQAFGFIKYIGSQAGTDPVSEEPGAKYHFVVETFKVGFANSRVNYFDCKVVVGSSRFFRDDVTLPGTETTRKITLLGTYGKEGPEGNEVTVFNLRTDPKENKKWNFADSFIKLVELGSASFVVTGETVIEVAAPGGKLEKKVPARAELLFDGKTEFNSDKQVWKSLFEVESVTFEKIGFGFTYTHGNAPGLGLGFVAGKSSWKIQPKATAINSFLSMFAIKWTGFRLGTGGPLKLPDLGFAPIKWPGTDLGEIFDFAFELEIDLGGLGKLAGDFKSIKLPCLLGWLRGGKGVSLGLQWPTLKGKLSLGIQQFIQLQADELQFGPCDAGVVLTLKKLRLVLLGEPLPKDDSLDAFAFVSTRHHGKTSWAFKYDKVGGDGGAWFSVEKLGFAHRVQVSTTGRSSVKDIVDQYQLPPKPASHCEVLENWKPIDNDNWLVLGKFKIAQLLQAWFIVDDNGAKPTYGLYVDLIDNIGVGLLYEKISDELGKFAGEIDLRKTFPPMNFGAATLTLPVIGLEYYTDGGFQIDIGFPWNNDFSRSARLSFGIYTGAGGLYYGRVNAAALEESILKVDRPGYEALPKDESGAELRRKYAHTVLLAGFALEVGYGKELELGILSARVAITVFGVLEGAMGWRKNPKGEVKIWYYKGKVGVNVHIEGSVNFLIIRARAVIRASIAVGLTKKRILARRRGGNREIGYLTCPTTLFIEAQLTVYAEATLSIGCVEITFHFEFHAKYTDEFELDSESFDEEAEKPSPAALPDVAVRPWLKSFGGPRLAEKKALRFLVGAMATLAHSEDFPGEQAEEGWVNCVVIQPLISATDFENLGEVLAAWYFQTVTKRVFGTGTTNLTEVRQVVKALQIDPQWSAAEVWPKLRDLLEARFEMTFAGLEETTPAMKDHFAVPPWPEVEWRLRTLQADGKPRTEVQPGRASASKMTAAYAQSVNELFQGQTRRGMAIPQGAPSAAAVQFVDYVKSLLNGLFSRMETTLIRDGEALETGVPSVRQLADGKVFAQMKAGETTSLAKLGAELNRSLLAGGRLPDPEDAKRYLPFARLTGQQFVVPPNLPEKPEDREKMRTEIFGLRNGTEVVKVTRGSTTLAEFFRAARVSRKALETALTPLATPTWTLHATELTIREAGDLRGTWPVHRFEGAFLHEIQKPNAGRNVSVIRYARKPAEPIKKPVQTPLPSTQWRPCLTAEFAARISMEGAQIELMGAPEVERSLLDRLVQEMKRPGLVFKLFGALREDLPANTDGEATPTQPLSFAPATSLVRTNLSRRARPLDQPQIRPLGGEEEKPYQATWEEQKQFIELLQIAGITNRGGYFLSSVGELPPVTDESKNKYVLTFILVQEKELEGELKTGFPWPAWANGISIEKPGDATMEHWYTMQFHGDRHWQIQPTAPAGAIAWAWRYHRAGNRPVSVLGEQINRLVARQFSRREGTAPASDRLVTDTRRLKTLRQAIRELATPTRNAKGGATLAELSEEEKNVRALLFASDGFSNAAQMLDFEMDGVRRDNPRVFVRLFDGDKTIPAPPDSREWAEKEQKTASDQPTPENEPVWIGSIPAAVVRADAGATDRLQAEEEKPWNHRIMQEVPLQPGGGTPENPYAMLAAFSAIQITAGFRDVYGNRLTQRLAPLRLPLFYTDALLSPGQWPHFSFIVLAESTAKKLIFRVEFAGLEAEFEETPAERAARLKRVREKEAPREAAYLDAVIKQLKGATGRDVRAELLIEAKNQAGKAILSHPTLLLEKLLPLLEAVLGDYKKFLSPEPGQPPGALPGKRAQEWTLILPAPKLAACARLTASIKISRTDFGPPANYLAALGVVEGSGIMQTEIPVRFFHGMDLAKPDAATEIERIAGNLQACLSAAWQGRVAYRQASRSDHEFWVIPRSAFPATPTNCFYWTARPWQTKLGSGSFPIPVLQEVPEGGGDTFESYAGAPARNLSHLDADVLGRSAFSFLARISREPAAVGSPKLRELLGHMDGLAKVLSATEGNHPFVVPLFARKPDEKEPGKAAKENIHDVLVDAVRSDLRAFYQVDTLIQYDLKITAADRSVVAFHGFVVPKWDRTSPLPHPSFSDFRILNRPASESGAATTQLGFSYDLPPGANYLKQVLESLAFEISHVQLEAPENQREEFALGPWLKLLPEGAVPLPNIVTIPAITREYPAKPEITQPMLSGAAVPEKDFKVRDLLAVKPEFTVGVRHMRDGTEPDANDFLDVVVQFNPEPPALAPRPLAAWTWISDLHVLLVLEELSAYFYGLPENQRGAQLRRILALAADACGQLVTELGRAVRAAALQAQNQDKLRRFNFNKPNDPPPDDPTPLTYTVGAGTAGEGITRKTLQRKAFLHLTAAGAEKSAVWAVQPSVVLVRNSEIFSRKVNGILTYTTERITTAEPIWAEVSPRLGGVNGWKIPTGTNPDLAVRLERFFEEFLGDPRTALDYDLDLILAHVFPLNASQTLFTKNIRHPIFFEQGKEFDGKATAQAIVEVLKSIKKTVGTGHFLELDITLRRNTLVAEAKERRIIFRERFWFEW